MLAVVGHDGMDLIDVTGIWVTLNVGDVDIVKVLGIFSPERNGRILVPVVNSLSCGIQFIWRDSDLGSPFQQQNTSDRLIIIEKTLNFHQ